jgi:hypothetical protein
VFLIELPPAVASEASAKMPAHVAVSIAPLPTMPTPSVVSLPHHKSLRELRLVVSAEYEGGSIVFVAKNGGVLMAVEYGDDARLDEEWKLCLLTYAAHIFTTAQDAPPC